MSGRKRCAATIRGLDVGGPVHRVRFPLHSAGIRAARAISFYVKKERWPRANIQFIFPLTLRDSLKSRTRRRLIELARAYVGLASRRPDWRWLHGRSTRSRYRKA